MRSGLNFTLRGVGSPVPTPSCLPGCRGAGLPRSRLSADCLSATLWVALARAPFSSPGREPTLRTRALRLRLQALLGVGVGLGVLCGLIVLLMSFPGSYGVPVRRGRSDT